MTASSDALRWICRVAPEHKDKLVGPEPADEMALRARTRPPPFLIARTVPGAVVTDWPVSEAEMAGLAFPADPEECLHCKATIEKRYHVPLHSRRGAVQVAEEGSVERAVSAEGEALEVHPGGYVLEAELTALMGRQARTAPRVPRAGPVRMAQ
jgi:hypothetical protein